nr:hypothetical protein [Streptomyces sp. 142MFCol3.1]
MTKLRPNGFAALLLVAVGVGVVRGIPLERIPDVCRRSGPRCPPTGSGRSDRGSAAASTR